jgi:hypothetical protein
LLRQQPGNTAAARTEMMSADRMRRIVRLPASDFKQTFNTMFDLLQHPALCIKNIDYSVLSVGLHPT